MAVALEGELTFARIPALLRQTDDFVMSAHLDLGRVSRADSAGLAFLLELTRRARARGLDLSLCNAPVQIKELAHFFGLDPILRFADSA